MTTNICSSVAEIDLDPIHELLVNGSNGPRWTPVKASYAIALYRTFLHLCVKYPGERLVPTPDIDTVWHSHILDTRKYQKDCQKLFGKYLHHSPYGSEDGEEPLQNNFYRTLELVAKEFPELVPKRFLGGSDES